MQPHAHVFMPLVHKRRNWPINANRYRGTFWANELQAVGVLLAGPADTAMVKWVALARCCLIRRLGYRHAPSPVRWIHWPVTRGIVAESHCGGGPCLAPRATFPWATASKPLRADCQAPFLWTEGATALSPPLNQSSDSAPGVAIALGSVLPPGAAACFWLVGFRQRRRGGRKAQRLFAVRIQLTPLTGPRPGDIPTCRGSDWRSAEQPLNQP